MRILITIILLSLAYTVGCGTTRSDKLKAKEIQIFITESLEQKSLMESASVFKSIIKKDAVDTALGYIKNNPGYKSFHLQEALRKQYPIIYNSIPDSAKISVLCSALENITFLNDWGHLGPYTPYDGEQAQLIIRSGKLAIRFLRPLLKNKKHAPLFGSQEATLSSDCKYRRCDFAYRYIMLIIGKKPKFHETPEERDKEIENLKNILDSDKF